VKTDAVDAATRAQWLRAELIPEARMIRNSPREIRDVLRSRLVMVSRCLPCQRANGALLEKYNVATAAAQRRVGSPEFGKMVAYTLLLEIDDIHRFPTVRHFHPYCRLVAGSHDSGGKTRHKRSRDGNRYLKTALHHAAIRAIQYFPEVKAEFQRWQRRKGKPIARALIAKELATIVYAMLAKGEAFNKQFHGHPVATEKRCTWPRLANPPA